MGGFIGKCLMKVAILQPNYIPWRGYFDFFKQCDVFVVYDDVQYTKNDWRNRNIIKTPDGPHWLTIPVKKHKSDATIKDIVMKENGWEKRHLEAIVQNYSKAPYFDEIYKIIEQCLTSSYDILSYKCMKIVIDVLDYLGIRVKIVYSSDIGYQQYSPSRRLAKICEHFGASEYLTGDAAKSYLEVEKFGNIKVLWHKYHEKVYPQLWGDFISRVSIIDTLFCCGRKTYDII